MNRTFFRLFPPPTYLSRPFVGFDISDQSIKFVELALDKNFVRLNRYGSVSIPPGVIQSGRIVDHEKFVEVLKEFRLKHNLYYVAVSLPEEQAYIVQLVLPGMRRRELRGSIELQLEGYVPLKAEEMVFDYEILSAPTRDQDNYQVSVSILPKKMVDNYHSTLVSAGYKPLVFEIEGQSLTRSLVGRGEKGTYLIADIGKMRTGFAVVVDGVVAFTSTVPNIGGEDITKSVAKNLSLSHDEAEKLKINKGLLRSADNKDLFYALVPVVSSLADEIRRVDDYWRSHSEGVTRDRFTKIILAGGQSTLSGLDDYLSANMGIPVEVGNPWTNLLSFDDHIPQLDRNNALRYSTAIGLAARGIHFKNHG